MWIVRWLFIFIILAIILGFALQNMDLVQVKILEWESDIVPLYWVVFAAFGLGVIAFMPLAVFHNFKHKLERSRLRSEIKQLKAQSETAEQEIRAPAQREREPIAEPPSSEDV